MKKLLSTLLGLALFLAIAPLTHAEFTVVPSAPHERQFNFEIPPGQSQTASIVIKNLGSNTLTVSTYSADGTNSSQGTFALTSRSREQRHIGNWVTFAEPTITIPPRTDVTVPFSIGVPDNATPGNYGGGIAVEATSAELSGNDPLNENGAVTTAARIFVRTFVNVPGERVNDYEWTDFGFNGKTDIKKPYFRFSFKNNGNTIVIAEPSIDLSGFPPIQETTLKLPEITIQPGTALENIELRWDDQPSFGYYNATANVKFSEFDIVANEKTNVRVLQQKMGINLTPPYITAIILVALLLLIVVVLYRVISMRQLRARSTSYKVKQGESITSIAEDYDINWKKLAKLNKIKRPYTLKVGQIILVPPKK